MIPSNKNPLYDTASDEYSKRYAKYSNLSPTSLTDVDESEVARADLFADAKIWSHHGGRLDAPSAVLKKNLSAFSFPAALFDRIA